MSSRMPYTHCRYCDRRLATNHIRRHERICPGNPAVQTELRQALHAVARHGCIPPPTMWDMGVHHHYLNLTTSNIYVAHFGSWDAVAAWADLLPASALADVLLELSRQEVRRISNDLHGDDIGCTAAEYETDRIPDAYHENTLRKWIGGWPAVIEWAGLILADRAYYWNRTRQLGVYNAELDGGTDPLPGSEYKQALPHGLTCLQRWRVVRQWNPGAHAWQPVAKMRVWEIR